MIIWLVLLSDQVAKWPCTLARIMCFCDEKTPLPGMCLCKVADIWRFVWFFTGDQSDDVSWRAHRTRGSTTGAMQGKREARGPSLLDDRRLTLPLPVGKTEAGRKSKGQIVKSDPDNEQWLDQ